MHFNRFDFCGLTTLTIITSMLSKNRGELEKENTYFLCVVHLYITIDKIEGLSAISAVTVPTV